MKWFMRHFEEIVSGIAFVAMLGIVTVNVFVRYFFDQSFSFTEEIAFIGFTYTVFFGTCILYKTHSLIAVDIIVDKLPFRFKKVTAILSFALLTVVNVYFVYLSWILSIGAWVRPTASLRIPYTFIDMAATISFALMAGYSVKFLVDAIQDRLPPQTEQIDMIHDEVPPHADAQ